MWYTTVAFIIAASVNIQAESIYVFILGGQSNMSGNASPNGLSAELKVKQENVLIHLDPNTDGASSRKGKWMPLEPGFGWCSQVNPSFGPELAFGNALAKKYPDDKFALIKSSVAGTDLAQQWRSPSSGGNVGKLYTGLVSEIKGAIESLDSKYEPNFVGMLWMQGEADAMSGKNSWANEYEKNLTNFIKDIRAEVKVDSMPFIAANIDEQSFWPNHAIVNGAMNNIAKTVPNVKTFPTKGFPTDNVHYTTNGMIQLGEAFAKAYFDLNYFKPIVAIASSEPKLSVTSPLSFTPSNVAIFDLSGRKLSTQSMLSGNQRQSATLMLLKSATLQNGEQRSTSELNVRK